MAFFINPSATFANTWKKSVPFAKKIPKNVRDAFNIANVSEEGIFKIENTPGLKLYDRAYIFADVNYTDRDNDEKQGVLLSLLNFLNFMSTDFKITIANEYRNMNEFISEIFTEKNKEMYPEIS